MLDLNPVSPRARVIIDNDFGGDPDGLFQLAHHLLSPSVEVRAVIGSQHYPGGFYGLSGSPQFACELAGQLMEILRPDDPPPILKGAATPMTDDQTPQRSDASDFIVNEAMRNDTTLPLFVACGAGLTSVASAYLADRSIAERIALVWIGGPEYDGLALPPPGAVPVEYNLGIDLRAAQIVFSESDIPIWQVPRNVYRQALVSHAELLREVKPRGPLGEFLFSRVSDLMLRAKRTLGEAYVLGDSPLVLLTALQSGWEPDASSSEYVLVPRPTITDKGTYQANPSAKPIRVYTRIDTRLMLADFYAKLAMFAGIG